MQVLRRCQPWREGGQEAALQHLPSLRAAGAVGNGWALAGAGRAELPDLFAANHGGS